MEATPVIKAINLIPLDDVDNRNIAHDALPEDMNHRSSPPTNNTHSSQSQHTVSSYDIYPMMENIETSTSFIKRHAIFEIDHEHNFHISNNPENFIIFHHLHTNIIYDQGSLIQTLGIGTIITYQSPTALPIILANVYYCPTITVSKLSISALQHNNPHYTIHIPSNISLDFQNIAIKQTYSTLIMRQTHVTLLLLYT